MRSTIALCLLIIAAPLLAPEEMQAAPKPSSKVSISAPDKPKARTLEQLIDLALKDGQDKTMDSEISEKLGFGKAKIREKRIYYDQAATPDKAEHEFAVVVRKNSKGHLEPIALRLARTTGKVLGGLLYIDGSAFRASLDGTLQRAFHLNNEDPFGEIVYIQLPVKSSKVREQFQAELIFHLNTSFQLGLKYAR